MDVGVCRCRLNTLKNSSITKVSVLTCENVCTLMNLQTRVPHATGLIRNTEKEPEQARGQQTSLCTASRVNLDATASCWERIREKWGTQEVMKREKNKGSSKEG